MSKPTANTAINSLSIVATLFSFFSRSGIKAGTSIIVGIGAWFSLAEAEGVKMIFTGVQKEFVYVAIALGIFLSLFVGYFFKWQYVKQEKNLPLMKFEWKYVVALVLSAIFGGILAYFITFHGLGYIAPETVIEEAGLAYIICFAVGGFSAWIVDALIFHPIVDGTVAALDNKAKADVLKAGQSLMKDPETLKRIYAKAATLGLVDDVKRQKLALLVSGENDPAFAQYVQILKAQ